MATRRTRDETVRQGQLEFLADDERERARAARCRPDVRGSSSIRCISMMRGSTQTWCSSKPLIAPPTHGQLHPQQCGDHLRLPAGAAAVRPARRGPAGPASASWSRFCATRPSSRSPARRARSAGSCRHCLLLRRASAPSGRSRTPGRPPRPHRAAAPEPARVGSPRGCSPSSARPAWQQASATGNEACRRARSRPAAATSANRTRSARPPGRGHRSRGGGRPRTGAPRRARRVAGRSAGARRRGLARQPQPGRPGHPVVAEAVAGALIDHGVYRRPRGSTASSRRRSRADHRRRATSSGGRATAATASVRSNSRPMQAIAPSAAARRGPLCRWPARAARRRRRRS